MSFCSPQRERTAARENTCFSREQLVRLANAWNNTNKGAPIKNIPALLKQDLWNELNKRMSAMCAAGAEWCWVDKLRVPDAAGALRPATPKNWRENPYEWLTNYDIDAVMRQYSADESYKYHFLGVFPIDFEARGVFGTCLFREICALDVKKLYKKGIRYLGMINNLDRHDQSGSHWTSTFIVIDPNNPLFGGYYYDSVMRPPPPEVRAFLERIGGGAREFKIDWSRRRHQFENTECGVFSMMYQIRWIKMLRDEPESASLDAVVNIPMNDEIVHKLRKVLFRPISGGGGRAKGLKKRT